MGVFGGSFNPPHRGHLAVARAALDELCLERVLLVPLCEPPHRPP
ncbi:MAG: adenylyltransferase/cytidyltransferase family protein, partial [Acidobacteriota bacterium]|nr:adenylyltransferase/cytidyltransferase family protein [Acidobacteriota bacterium]